MNENLHKGHRQRLKNKFLVNPDLLSEHEVLEMLLYFSIKRGNTNGIAHKLLASFGTLSGVLSADVSSLAKVDGVGESVAFSIKLFGALVERAKKEESTEVIFRYTEQKEKLIEKFKSKREESFMIILLDKRFKVLFTKEFLSCLTTRVDFNLKQIAKILATTDGVEHLIVCHNHLSGNLDPTKADDEATTKLAELATLHDVDFADHIIVTDSATFSYYYSGRLTDIIEKKKI